MDGAQTQGAVEIDNLVAETKKYLGNVYALLKNVGDAGTCKGCGDAIFWVQHKNGKRTPYDTDGTNHFATCTKADNFRRGKQ